MSSIIIKIYIRVKACTFYSYWLSMHNIFHRANTGIGRMNRLIQVNSFSHKYIIRANIKMLMKRYVTLKGMQQSLVCMCLNVLKQVQCPCMWNRQSIVPLVPAVQIKHVFCLNLMFHSTSVAVVHYSEMFRQQSFTGLGFYRTISVSLKTWGAQYRAETKTFQSSCTQFLSPNSFRILSVAL